jgi:hypothetical protein
MKNSLLTIISFLFALTVSAQVNFNNNTVSAENYSSALGENNISTGTTSFVSGYNSQALGNYSIAMGNTALAAGLSSISLGAESTASGMYSTAIGRYTVASGDASFALGYSNYAQTTSSYLFGEYLKSTAGGSIVIGMGAGTGNNLLVNNKGYSMMIGFKSIYPTLFIEGKTSTNNDKTGKVGIGNITSPTAKLHIKADDNENASLKLEPTGSGYNAQILLGDDVHTITAKPNDDFKFSIPSGRNFVFENGKIKTTAFQLTDGQQGEGKYLRSDANGNASWEASNVSSFECLASGLYSSAIGKWDTAFGENSFAGGYNSKAYGAWSFVFGAHSIVDGTNSVAIGHFVGSIGTHSMVLGFGNGSTNRLVNSISNSLMIGFGSEKPTLFVGPSGPGYTGKIGIGEVTEPQAKLHIKGDQDEQASLFIESYQFGGSYDAELWMGTEEYGLKAAYGRMYFNTGGNYIFNSADANVGIGTLNPLAKLQVNGDVFIEDENAGLILKSPDGQCWKITVNNSGELTTTSINCNLTTGNTSAIQPEKGIIRIYPNPTKDLVTIENNNTVPVFATLRDLNGTLLTTQKLQPGDNSLSLQDMATGYYIITIMDNQNQVISSEKIMKK